MAKFASSAHWRDSSRPARFFMVDARAAFPLLLFLMHIRVWTFAIAILFTAIFSSLEYYGFTVTVFLRWLRSTLAGSRKNSTPWWKQ